MSVPPPPFLCSTPPPPDVVDDDDDDDGDDFAYPYPDASSFSPVHDVFHDQISETHVDYPSKDISSVEVTTAKEVPSLKPILEDGSPEENNVEDLDLRLNGLQLDPSEKDNPDGGSFDDFCTFLNSPYENDSKEFYLSKAAVDSRTAEADDSASTSNVSESDTTPVDEVPKEPSETSLDNFQPVEVDFEDADDFCDFKYSEQSPEDLKESNPKDSNSTSPEKPSPEEIPDDDDDDDFGAVFSDTRHSQQTDTVSIPKDGDLRESFFGGGDNDVAASDGFEEFAAFQDDEQLPRFSDPVETFPEPSDDDDDDFGDFDTYVPNSDSQTDDENLVAEASTQLQQLDSRVSGMFPEEIKSEDRPEEGNCELNKSLGESWAHLMEYEIERSYLFPWNNSSSQKSLLKCLGIDSRNILFGHKWNTNMPRFAANLGSNPLQPIKQPSGGSESLNNNNVKHVDANSECHPSSDGDVSWSDAVQDENNDLQATSYAESLLLDLEHLMATLDQMTSSHSADFKISDLFSNACGERDDHSSGDAGDFGNSKSDLGEEVHVPPSILNIGRKINLPDTHIFTPTDSETPWSHTIHYSYENLDPLSDIGHRDSHIDSIAMSNVGGKVSEPADFDDFQSFRDGTVLEPIGVAADQEVFEGINRMDTLSNSRDDFDEFGDFQSAKSETSVQSMPPNPTVNLLEPTKLNVNAPTTVNWPAPGEVNYSIMDDFSEPSSNEAVSLPPYFAPPVSAVPSHSFVLKESKITSDNEVSTTPFDFKPRVNATKMNGSSDGVPPLPFQITTTSFGNEKRLQNVDDDFDDFISAKYTPSDNFNSPNPQRPKINNIMPSFESHPPPPELVPVSYAAPPPKNSTQQILQPLSLENYAHINWPDPGADFQDFSRFNPVDSIKSYSEAKDTAVAPKAKEPIVVDDDGWSDFVSTKPSSAQPSQNGTGKDIANDGDDWSDFVSNTAPPSKSFNELKTISQNIHSLTVGGGSSQTRTNRNAPSTTKPSFMNVTALPHLTYVSPKSNVNNRSYTSQFQNL